MPTLTPELVRYALAPLFTPLVGIVVAILFLVWLVVLLMRPRRFYLIRHGETLLNALYIKQGAEGDLSELGKQQDDTIGKLLAPLGIGKILTSPYSRAQDTAQIINRHLHVRIVVSPLLAERRSPSAVIGKSTRDPEVERIVDHMDLAYHEDDYRYADEENFLDLKKRARKCLRYLASAGALRTCVITHHAFLKMLLSYMSYREKLHAKDYVKLSFFNNSDNGGISIAEYHPWKCFNDTRGWEVVSYNETVE